MLGILGNSLWILMIAVQEKVRVHRVGENFTAN